MMRKLTAFTMLSIALSSSLVAWSDQDYRKAFNGKWFDQCDVVANHLQAKCVDMICNGEITGAHKECWKKSLNSILDKRLVHLKTSDPAEFHKEMILQKSFNEAAQSSCGVDCGSDAHMHGIPYNFCLVDAYRYRTNQAKQINHENLQVSGNTAKLRTSNKDKKKYTFFYKAFVHQLCQMPKEVWKDQVVPVDCENTALKELNSLEFTDDVCDLT
jgi:hypothetical protein